MSTHLTFSRWSFPVHALLDFVFVPRSCSRHRSPILILPRSMIRLFRFRILDKSASNQALQWTAARRFDYCNLPFSFPFYAGAQKAKDEPRFNTRRRADLFFWQASGDFPNTRPYLSKILSHSRL